MKMQLEKSFCFNKWYLRFIVAFMVVIGSAQLVVAQNKEIDHKVVKKETLYKLSILYRTEIDSIMAWNKMTSTMLNEGAVIRILDYNKLKLEEFIYNQYVYDIQVKKLEKALLKQQYDDKIVGLEQRKDAIDDTKPQAMQAFFEIAKIKKAYIDSFELSNKMVDEEIKKLQSEKDEIEEDIKRKYPKQYAEQGYATTLKEKEDKDSFNVARIDAEYPNGKGGVEKEAESVSTMSKVPEDLPKVVDQNAIDEQKQWEKEEKARLDQIAKELKEQEKLAKKEEEAKAQNLEVFEEEQLAKKALEDKLKEETAAALKKEQLDALQREKEAEKLAFEKEQKEAEKLVKEAELLKKNEAEKLAKEQLEAENKALAELSEEDLKILQLQKELAAMQAAKEKKQKELAAAKNNSGATQDKPNDLDSKNETIGVPSEKVARDTIQMGVSDQQNKELMAMQKAKQEAKAAKEDAQWKAKLQQDSIAKFEYDLELKKTESKDPNILIFDVVYESDQDTSSKKYKKQQAMLSKEFDVALDSSKVTRSVTVDEVVIEKSKKANKYKMGDEVDAIGIDKSRFFLSRAMIEIDKGNYKKAIEYTDKSIDLNPNYTEAYMLKGDMLASFGYFDKAYSQYEKANTVNSRIPQLHYNMGNCLIYMGKKDKALMHMGRAITIDPTYILAYSGRSALLFELAQYENAVKDYTTILDINKYFYPALKGRGLAYLNLGEYQEAIRDFNQLLEYDKEDPSIYYHRGIAKMYMSEIYGACMDFLTSSERGYAEADKAINKYCD